MFSLLRQNNGGLIIYDGFPSSNSKKPSFSSRASCLPTQALSPSIFFFYLLHGAIFCDVHLHAINL